jgi:hypothetical protein
MVTRYRGTHFGTKSPAKEISEVDQLCQVQQRRKPQAVKFLQAPISLPIYPILVVQGLTKCHDNGQLLSRDPNFRTVSDLSPKLQEEAVLRLGPPGGLLER